MVDMQKFTTGLHDYMARALQPLADRIKALEERAPQKGEPGRDGQNGRDGSDGKSISIEDVQPLIDAAVEAIPHPKDGQDGRDGRDGVDGKDGASMAIEDVERMVAARMAEWALDFERRAQGVLERAVERMPRPADGKDGRDGADGRDGLGFDDLSVEQSGERGVVLRFARADAVREFPLAFPVVVDRGVHKADAKYMRGDAVTFGGSLWIAQKDAPSDKPGQGDGWRLAVKKGRDGRDGKDGERGLPGKDGKGEFPRGGGPY